MVYLLHIFIFFVLLLLSFCFVIYLSMYISKFLPVEKLVSAIHTVQKHFFLIFFTVLFLILQDVSADLSMLFTES